jgi:hypothetical protein
VARARLGLVPAVQVLAVQVRAARVPVALAAVAPSNG